MLYPPLNVALAEWKNLFLMIKFKDADLIGIPFRINVGRDAADGKVEFKVRGSNYGMDMKKGETVVIDSNEAVKNIISVVSENS